MGKNIYSDKVYVLLSELPYVKVKRDPINSHLSTDKKAVKNCVVLNDNTKHCFK